MKKKGVMYLAMAMIFVMIFVVLFLFLNRYDYTSRGDVVEVRVRSIDAFIGDFHDDLKRAAFISGFRAMLGLEEYLSVRGSFFANTTELEESFREVFTYGTINGTPSAIMENASFNDYLTKVSFQAQMIDIGVAVNISNVTLAQDSPWVIKVTYQGHFNVTDLRKTVWWEYDRSFTAFIPIYDLKDPLYTVNTLGKVPNTIRNYSLPAQGFVNDTDNTTTTLQDFMYSSYYRASIDAPSFLQRFTNNFSANPDGIESLVYIPRLSDQGIVVSSDKSVVDYLYFQNGTAILPQRCTIQNMVFFPDWFRIDEDHADDYELSPLSYTPCP